MTVEFEFTDEVVELRSMVNGFCEEFSPEAVVRTTMESETGYDPVLWRRLGSELGVLGLDVPEKYGGAEAGLVAHAVVVEELGAALVCGPVLGTLVLAMPALCAVADEAVKAEYLPDLVSGERTATLAAPFDDGGFDADALTVSAVADDEGWRLDGSVAQVPDAAAADLLLVAARTADGPGLFVVEAVASGLAASALTTLDSTRRQAQVRLDAVPARLLATREEATAVLDHVAALSAVLVAVGQVGCSQRMLDTTVAHVSSRLQFGQPVGAYQAVKHRCANMLVALEQARSAAYHGVWALQDDLDDHRLAASLAKAVASETSLWVATSAIQLHGGLGFTWEGTPQLYFKRASTDALTLGTATQHIERVARYATGEVTERSTRSSGG